MGQLEGVGEMSEARCVAHGYRRCTWCSLNPADCAGIHPSCGTYSQDGMHWDTCPNRVKGDASADKLGIDLPILEEGAVATPREEVLTEAASLIVGDRNKTYGSPTENFKNTADIWNVLLGHKLRERITPTEVATLMVGLKLARTIAQPKRDNFVDMAGYAACGWETVEESGE